MLCPRITVCYSASTITQSLFIVYAKWCRKAVMFCNWILHQLSSASIPPPPPPLPLLISVPCTLLFTDLLGLASLNKLHMHSLPLKMPRVLHSTLYLSVLIFKDLFFPPSFSPSCPAFLLLIVGEGHGMHHPQWFTAVPVLPSGLQSADTAPDAESDFPPQGPRGAGLYRYTHTHFRARHNCTVRQSQ